MCCPLRSVETTTAATHANGSQVLVAETRKQNRMNRVRRGPNLSEPPCRSDQAPPANIPRTTADCKDHSTLTVYTIRRHPKQLQAKRNIRWPHRRPSHAFAAPTRPCRTLARGVPLPCLRHTNPSVAHIRALITSRGAQNAATRRTTAEYCRFPQSLPQPPSHTLSPLLRRPTITLADAAVADHSHGGPSKRLQRRTAPTLLLLGLDVTTFKEINHAISQPRAHPSFVGMSGPSMGANHHIRMLDAQGTGRTRRFTPARSPPPACSNADNPT